MRGFTPLLILPLLCACPSADDGDTGAGDTTTDATGEATTSDTDEPTTDTTGSTSGETETADETGAGLSGEELFLSICSPCHGMNGEGTALGYELQHPVRPYASWVVRNGRPGVEFEGSAMAAYSPDLVSDADLDEIWDYLDGFPQPTTGEGLYLDYCRNCHGEDAAGGPTGVDIHEETYPDVLQKVREGEDADFSMRMLYMPAFDPTTLSDAELQLISDHIATL